MAALPGYGKNLFVPFYGKSQFLTKGAIRSDCSEDQIVPKESLRQLVSYVRYVNTAEDEMLAH